MDSRKISIAITSWNRYSETLDSFVQIANREDVREIVIVDDNSDLEIYKRLQTAVSFCDKVKLFRNEINFGCYFNKKQAMSLTDGEFICLFDSDNTLTNEYLDKVFEQEWDENTILAPDFAMPNFSYQEFGGVTVDKSNVSAYMERPMFSTCLNTCNFVVNKKKYLEVFDTLTEPMTCDSIYFNYCWLKNGGKIHIVKGLQYPHLVHENSHYKKFLNQTRIGLAEEIENNLRNLK